MSILKKSLALLFTAVVVFSVFTGCSKPKNNNFDISKIEISDSDISKIETNVDEALRQNEFEGGAAITINDKDVYLKSFGYADPIKNKKLTNNTPYDIGSLTMNFTGAAVLMLEKSGKLNLSDTLDKYFDSKYGESLSKVTVEQLLANSVSFGSYSTEIWKSPDEADKLKSLLTAEKPDKYTVTISNIITDYILRHGYVKKNKESSSNYYLLGKIISKASGTSYRDYLKKNIFDKLGMKNSGFISSKDKFAGYDMNNKVWKRFSEYPTATNFGFVYSYAGITSCPKDLSLFYKSLVNGTLGKIDYMDKFKLEPSSYYCGFTRDGNNISSKGRIAVHCAYVHINIETNEAVSLLSNRVGKTDIKNTGDELYSILSSKINGIIISSVKKS